MNSVPISAETEGYNAQSSPEAASSNIPKPDSRLTPTLDSENQTGNNSFQASNDKGSLFQLHNQTPNRLRIVRKEDVEGEPILVLAPLEERKLTLKAQDAESLKTLESERLISCNELKPVEKLNLEGIGTAIFIFAITYFAISSKFVSDYPEWKNLIRFYIPMLALSVLAITAIYISFGRITVLRTLQQAITLLLVIATGGGLTATTIYYFGGGKQLLHEGTSIALLGRLLQFAFITVASLFPALLYFLFDRNRLGTLRTHFEQQIFRFDLTVKTLADVHAKYGSQLDELYGRDTTTAKGRHIPGTRWPIWVCTLVITIGWLVTLHPVDASIEKNSFQDFLQPGHSAITFGFLGAYFFAILSISRRYTRGDLQPKAYSHIVVRILTVFILAWIVESTANLDKSMTPLIFLIGVIPET